MEILPRDAKNNQKGAFMRIKKILGSLMATVMVASVFLVSASALTPQGNDLSFRNNWLTNKSDYSFSAEYMSSRWYQNFSKLELTGNQRNDVLAIAISQLGYHEGDSTADFNGANTSGSSNYVEYVRLPVDKNGNPWDAAGDFKNNFFWCATFVNWCLNQAGVDHAGAEVSCWKWITDFLKPNGLWQDSAAYGGTYTPQPGDMIFFNWSGTNTGSGHIGFVLYTDGTNVHTIEGNADDNVTKRTYSLSSNQVIGYGVPNYTTGNTPTFNYNYAGNVPKGNYVVMVPSDISKTQTTAAFKSSPADGSDNIVDRIPIGTMVEALGENSGNYTKIKYNGQEGWISYLFVFFMMESIPERSVLTYNANGGTGAPAPKTVKTVNSFELSKLKPTRAGYVFLGWANDANATTAEFQPGDTVKINGDTTIYAVWEEIAEPETPPPETIPETEPVTEPETEPETMPLETIPVTQPETEDEDLPPETLPPETLPETVDEETTGEVTDESTEASAEASTETSDKDKDDKVDKNAGCSGVIGSLSVVGLVAAGFAIVYKKKEDN